MNRFPKSVLEGASIAGLERLAAWLGVAPVRDRGNERQHRSALVLAICRAEKRIAKARRAEGATATS